MSECRCSEIVYYREQIESLSVVSERLNNSSGMITQLTDDLNNLSRCCGEGYTASEADRVSAAIKGADDSILSAKAHLHQRIISRKTHLLNRLSQIEQEDKEYHEEEERKAKEAAELAALQTEGK